MDNPQNLSISDSPSFVDEPLEALLEKPVHEMSDVELDAFVKYMAVLRSSAQSRKAAVEKTPKARKTSTSKTSPDAAMALLNQLLQ